MRPIFEHYRTSRRVIAVDLPGFGFSDRSDRHYDIALYQSAIDAMLDYLVDQSGIRCRRACALAVLRFKREPRDDLARTDRRSGQTGDGHAYRVSPQRCGYDRPEGSSHRKSPG